MALVMIKCPTTGKPIATGLATESLDAEPLRDEVVSCPECGEDHVWQREDAYLEDQD